MSGHDAAERAYIQAVLDARADRLNEVSAQMTAEVDALRKSWSSGTELADHEARLQAMRNETATWIRSNFVDGEASEPAPTTSVAGSQVDAPAGSSPASPPGPGPRQPTPHEAELQRAREIADMPMHEYAARRAELGVQSPTSMNKLFS